MGNDASSYISTRHLGRRLDLRRLTRDFFARYTPDVARDLLGKVLVRQLDGKTLTGRIVETEAYRGRDDPASHAFRGPTKRTMVMFGRAGLVYVFFSYGFHWCLNITTEATGEPGAVLIRAIEPLRGIEEMRHRRRMVKDLRLLTSGPGRLTQALGIDASLNGEDVVTSRRLYLVEGKADAEIASSPRVGLSIGRETPWRYYLVGNPFVSKARTQTLIRAGLGRGS